MYSHRDSRAWIIRAPLLATLAPLAALATYNLLGWRVVWPIRGGLGVFTDTPRVLGALLLEGGLAIALVAWMLLVGSDRHERRVIAALVAATLAVAAGLTLMVCGFVMG